VSDAAVVSPSQSYHILGRDTSVSMRTRAFSGSYEGEGVRPQPMSWEGRRAESGSGRALASHESSEGDSGGGKRSGSTSWHHQQSRFHQSTEAVSSLPWCGSGSGPTQTSLSSSGCIRSPYHPPLEAAVMAATEASMGAALILGDHPSTQASHCSPGRPSTTSNTGDLALASKAGLPSHPDHCQVEELMAIIAALRLELEAERSSTSAVEAR